MALALISGAGGGGGASLARPGAELGRAARAGRPAGAVAGSAG